MASGRAQKKRASRSYRPVLEAMEALRLLSSGATSALPSGLAAEHNVLLDQTGGPSLHGGAVAPVSSDAWDAALLDTRLPDLLAVPDATSVTTVETVAPSRDPAALASGLAQLNKYLSRTWYRAYVPVQSHEDSTQAVYATLLQNLGRDQFDTLVTEVGHSGIKDVFTRETNEGVAFFRAVEMVKKRAQRERAHTSLEGVEAPATPASPQITFWREALREAIDQNLSPKEASLINDSLMGKTPAEIALHWGVAPKTISNEKARVIQKLRDALITQAGD